MLHSSPFKRLWTHHMPSMGSIRAKLLTLQHHAGAQLSRNDQPDVPQSPSATLGSIMRVS